MLKAKSWIVLSCWDIIADLKLRKTLNLFIYIHLSFFCNHRISNYTTNYFLNKWIDMFLQLWVSGRKRVSKMCPHEKWQFSSTIQTLHHVCKFRQDCLLQCQAQLKQNAVFRFFFIMLKKILNPNPNLNLDLNYSIGSLAIVCQMQLHIYSTLMCC